MRASTVTLSFESLPRGFYGISSPDHCERARVPLRSDVTYSFRRYDDATADIAITFADTRYERSTGVVAYDVRITN